MDVPRRIRPRWRRTRKAFNVAWQIAAVLLVLAWVIFMMVGLSRLLDKVDSR